MLVVQHDRLIVGFCLIPSQTRDHDDFQVFKKMSPNILTLMEADETPTRPEIETYALRNIRGPLEPDGLNATPENNPKVVMRVVFLQPGQSPKHLPFFRPI